MQIIFDEDDIKTALANHATSMVTVKEDMEITIDMKAGRGENGYSATLNIQPKAPPAAAAKAPRTKPVAVAEEPLKPSAPAKTGLFGSKPTIVGEAQKAEPAPEPELVAEPQSGISSGEDRGEQEDAIQPNFDTPEEPLTEGQTAEAPAEQPKSIFNFGGAKAGA